MTLRWPAEAIWEAVEPLLPGFSVEVLPQLDSTNSELMRRAHQGQCDPVLLVAERQTAGRGRRGRQWLSDDTPVGHALTFSLGLRLQPAAWSGLSLAVGLSLAQALHPRVQLKWPNDLWVDGGKLGGVLIETAVVKAADAGADAARYVVIGTGLNVGPRPALGLPVPPAALRGLSASFANVQAPDVLEQLALPLVKATLRFARDGFGPWVTDYTQRDMLRGAQVLCSNGVSGVADGVDSEGALLVHTASGLQKITSAEVSVRPVGAPPAASAD